MIGAGFVLIAPFIGGVVSTVVVRAPETLPVAIAPIFFGLAWFAWSLTLSMLGRAHPDAPDHWFFHVFWGGVAALGCSLGCWAGAFFSGHQRDHAA
jgi:hypothetical protein